MTLRTMLMAIGLLIISITSSLACTADTIIERAAAIGHGHAYNAHVVTQGEFKIGHVEGGLAYPGPKIESADDFSNLIAAIMSTPSDNKPLNNERHAYWDDKTGTVVIYNPGPVDCGTAFRPHAGKTYYENLT